MDSVVYPFRQTSIPTTVASIHRTTASSASFCSKPRGITKAVRRFKEQNLEELAAIPEQLGTSHQAVTPEPEVKPILDERNREYQIRRAALGDNPTKEEMMAVVAYGLQQHRLHFPHLYDD